MTTEIALVLSILAAAVVLFATERLRVDLVALMVLLGLLLTGLVTVEQAFSGFSNPAVITVWAIYIVSASLTRTGIADIIGQYIGRIAGSEERRLIFVLMLSVGVMSAFMNNIGAAAVMLPVTVALGRRADVPASRLLIPLAFGSLLGGLNTLIGTPPNLLISDALADAGLEPFSLFDFTPVGLIIMFSSIAYMVLIGRRLLPSYATHEHTDELTKEYRLRDYLTELHVLPGSALVGQSLSELRLGEMYNVTVIGLTRDGNLQLRMQPDVRIERGDVLLVEGQSEQILALGRTNGIAIVPDRVRDEKLQSEDVSVAEVVVSQLARFVGQTVREIDFRGRYGLNVLAIWREEAPLRGRLADVTLRLGDTLLVQGHHQRIEAIRDDNAFLLLRPPSGPSRRLSKAPMNFFIFVTMISLVTLGVLHISTAAVLGAVLALLTGCLTMDEAYNAIEWKSVFLIAGMLPMGIAMETTGTAQFLADIIIGGVGNLGPRAVMVGLFVLTTILTAFMSNAAAAVLVAPIAIQTAANLGANPHAFVMGVAIAASSAFVTPIGHQACVLVYGPGGYRFFDFTKVGVPLTLLIWVLMVVFLPLFFPL